MHISSNCVQHQQHLGFKASLLISEYVLRNMLGADIGHGARLSDPWKHRWQLCGRAPPKCLSGRWGAAHLAEEHVLKAPHAHLEQVMGEVLKESAQKRRRTATPSLDAEHDEDMAAYAAKLGRWRADTLRNLADHRWRCVLELSHHARAPWHHFHCAAMKYSGPPGDPQEGAVSFVARLVWGKAGAIAGEFEKLLQRDQWNHTLDRCR
eukprot:9155085-Lingulodinium_polyedra.AAC.1